MKKIFAASIALLFIAGCKNNPSGPDTETVAPSLVKAVYVLNEGNYGDPSGARLTLYDVQHDSAYQDVFESANSGQHLGSTGDDIKIFNGKAYILMSGSENLDVIGLTDNHLQQSATFAGDTPHDIVIDSLRNRAYITRLYKNSILIINLTTLSVMDSVTVGANPQGMVIVGDQLYVCNSGYGSDKTVSAIDLNNNSVKKTITVGDGPASAVVASDGRLWIACTGNAYGTPPSFGKIFIVNPATNLVQDSIVFDENIFGTIAMGNDGSAYVLGVTLTSYYGGPVHRVASKTVQKSFIAGTYYGLAVDDVSGDIYVADAKEFGENGEVGIYKSDGSKKINVPFKAGRGPSTFAFKR